MPTLTEWEEPNDCPKCGCGWGVRITEKGIVLIFCSNSRCTFSWRTSAKTLLEAVQAWNKICRDHNNKDRPNTPLLVQIYNKGKDTLFRTKDLTDKTKVR